MSVFNEKENDVDKYEGIPIAHSVARVMAKRLFPILISKRAKCFQTIVSNHKADRSCWCWIACLIGNQAFSLLPSHTKTRLFNALYQACRALRVSFRRYNSSTFTPNLSSISCSWHIVPNTWLTLPQPVASLRVSLFSIR